MSFQLPSENKQILQPNNGDVFGNVWSSFGVDYSSNRGRIRGGTTMISVVDEATASQLSGYAAQFVEYGGYLWAISDQPFRVSDTNITGTWALDTDTGSPSAGNTVIDACEFDGILLSVDGNDIVRNPGDGDWDSWWTGIRGQSALSTGQRFFLKVGPQNDLFIIDAGNKVYRVEANGSGTGTITKTGAGTLDFSYRPYQFTCMEMTSTRMWIGFEDTSGGQGGVIEWDMSASSLTPNRIHLLGTRAVRCIAIWDDTPIAVLSDGDIKRFSNGSFVDYEGMQFPSAKTDLILDDDFIHNNGWAIIDGLPHFLVRGQDDTQGSNYLKSINSPINFSSGVWCLDPSVGLYNRFPVGKGASTPTDYGHIALRSVGALHAVENANTKFFASYEYYTGSTTLGSSVIAYHDIARSKASRSWFITTPSDRNDTLQSVETAHKRLSSGDEIRFYFRQKRDANIILDGTWADTTHFHTTDTATGVEKGDVLFVKTGKGAGWIHRISNVDTSVSVTVITVEEANTMITAGDAGSVEVMNFRFLGKINNTQRDMETFDIPSVEKRRGVQLLVELRQAAGSTIELDNVTIE